MMQLNVGFLQSMIIFYTIMMIYDFFILFLIIKYIFCFIHTLKYILYQVAQPVKFEIFYEPCY